MGWGALEWRLVGWDGAGRSGRGGMGRGGQWRGAAGRDERKTTELQKCREKSRSEPRFELTTPSGVIPRDKFPPKGPLVDQSLTMLIRSTSAKQKTELLTE